MFAKFKDFSKLFKDAVVLTPVELIASVIFFLAAVIDYHSDYRIEEWLFSFFACFSLIYVVNRLTRGTTVCWLYYLTILSIPGFYWWSPSPNDSVYWITLLISQLLVTLSCRQTDNDSFVANVLCYLRDMAGALLLTLLGWGLSCAIYFSIVYIFDLYVVEARFMAYSGEAAIFLVAPFIFLMFDTRRYEGFAVNPFFKVLINFIISPALLIYNLVLYAYFIKIAALWSLPKGGVAYMVLSFIALLIVSKSVQSVLERRYYAWYYKYYSFWILPPVVVLWISVLYRIREYGWTEDRVYLFLVAIVATVTVFLFFYSRWGKYRWVVLISIGLLALFTYIPGIEAKELGLYSQENRMKNAVKLVYSENEDKWTENMDSLTFKQYEILYNSSRYVQRLRDTGYMQEHFGFSYQQLEYLFPPQVMARIRGDEEQQRTYSLNYYDEQTIAIDRFDTLQIVESYKRSDNIYSRYEGSRLIISRGADTLIDVDLNCMFRNKLAEVGMDTTGVLSVDKLEQFKNAFEVYDIEDQRIILEYLLINVDDASIKAVRPRFLLVRKK